VIAHWLLAGIAFGAGLGIARLGCVLAIGIILRRAREGIPTSGIQDYFTGSRPTTGLGNANESPPR
jgi:hypothetical protein